MKALVLHTCPVLELGVEGLKGDHCEHCGATFGEDSLIASLRRLFVRGPGERDPRTETLARNELYDVLKLTAEEREFIEEDPIRAQRFEYGARRLLVVQQEELRRAIRRLWEAVKGGDDAKSEG